ncbi:MAG: HlyD family secretion protein [Elusimicrobia bacterium]|nr:HlyD family secretion protein [Elusimicrobiota bacterium]
MQPPMGIAPSPVKVAGASNRAKAVIGGVALAAIATGGFLLANRGWESTDDAFIEGHVVTISPRVAGHVVRVLIDDNQMVKKGDILAEIDPRDYATKADQARADVEGAQAAVRKTQDDVRRYRDLNARNEASGQTLDHARADAQAATAALNAAHARLRQAELDLSYTKIEAPQAGRVTRKSVEEGAYVAVGQSLLTLVPSEVWVVANFKETQLKRMHPGQRAEIRVDAYDGKLGGRVDSLQSGTGARFSVLPAENATGNYVKVVQRVPVKIVLDRTADSARLLAPGMSVEAEVEVK